MKTVNASPASIMSGQPDRPLSELLHEAWNLMNSTEKRCKGAFARRSDGYLTSPLSHTAASFDSSGAMRRVVKLDSRDDQLSIAYMQMRTAWLTAAHALGFVGTMIQIDEECDFFQCNRIWNVAISNAVSDETAKAVSLKYLGQSEKKKLPPTERED